MLEAVEELLDLLETQKTLLDQGREAPNELLERLQLASASVGEIAERMRRDPSPAAGAEARALKAGLEQHFVRAFRLTRDNEQRMKSADLGKRPARSGANLPKPRGTPREIERRYRERIRLGAVQDENGR